MPGERFMCVILALTCFGYRALDYLGMAQDVGAYIRPLRGKNVTLSGVRAAHKLFLLIAVRTVDGMVLGGENTAITRDLACYQVRQAVIHDLACYHLSALLGGSHRCHLRLVLHMAAS